MGTGGNGIFIKCGDQFRRRFKTPIALAIGWFVLTACGGGGGSTPAPTPLFTVSGTFLAAPGNAVDSDVNDTFTTPVPNNDFSSAQAIARPVILEAVMSIYPAAARRETPVPAAIRRIFTMSR